MVERRETTADLPLPDLIERAAAGDRSAQQRVLESQYDFVRRMLYRLAGPSADIDDLHQTVLLRILTSLGSYRADAALSTWVASICVHVCKDHWRRRKVRSVMLTGKGAHAAIDATEGGHDPEGGAIRREQLALARAALEQMPPSQRTAYVLRIVYGYSVDEIAKITNAARSTTRMRLYYGRKTFAKALAELGERADAIALQEEET